MPGLQASLQSLVDSFAPEKRTDLAVHVLVRQKLRVVAPLQPPLAALRDLVLDHVSPDNFLKFFGHSAGI